MRSLKARLFGLWGLSLLSSLVLGLLLVTLYQQSTAAQISRAQAVLARSCDLLRDRYAFSVAGWTGQGSDAVDVLQRALVPVVEVALSQQDGVEGGIWKAGRGSLAYAYPTYEGSGPKSDIPQAETAQIAHVNAAALRAERTVSRTLASRKQTLLLAACPLEGPVVGVTGWTMTRVQGTAGSGAMMGGLVTLLALLLLSTVLLGRTMLVWGRHVRGIEATLANTGTGLPAVRRSGERELDQIIDALNSAGERVAAARREQEALAVRVAHSERLAAVGRVAAGVAHEIRNPIAAARLQGENGLAGDDQRRRESITDMLVQLDRLDGLVSELLAMTQRAQPSPVTNDLSTFLREAAARHAETAAARGLTITVTDADGQAWFDPWIVGRILDNLLTNAIRHAAVDGRITLSGQRTAGTLTFAVANDGGGVPDELADRLFEPFVTGRADGTGLGLAIARELADAHGGCLLLHNRGGGGVLTDFVLELPQENS